jgi:hypothetical protein
MADTTMARYPVVLSDALLGKPSKDIFTGVRCTSVLTLGSKVTMLKSPKLTISSGTDNHKPNVLSGSSSATARLNPTSNSGTFDLTVDDHGDRHTYSGVRTTKDGNYVLIFDPDRQVFVLHRLDSLFHMNVTQTPDNSSVDSLRRQFPQLDVHDSTSNTAENKDAPKGSTAKAAAAKARPSKPAKASSALRKPTAKKPTTTAKKPSAKPEPSKLMPPPPAPPTTTTTSTKSSKKAAQSPESEEEDEDDDDDDGGLIVEYPGGFPRGGAASAAAGKTPFGSTFVQPPVTITRRFSDFVRNSDEDDAQPAPPQQQQQQRQPEEETEPELNFTFEDGDDDDDEEMEDVAGFKLPSPVDGRVAAQQQPQAVGYGEGAGGGGEDDADGEDDDDLADLEADLEAEFEKATGYQSESDVSEED